ncbi:G protein-coupled glucose receptor regulating Gpa2-domain-containing protein [Aspergillus pseudodeflectus]|uniref:G protein-coupled glucose receptor regulating Gpa2-domain-containing protein n=1 Tax=Aspergillus pseudodeflectus TaxID=176178 RepID=A0ABR4JF51_9EURO
MAALIRAIQLLNSGQDNDHSNALHRRFHGPTTEVLTPSTKAGFIAMGICGLLSFTSTLGLLLFLMHRFINWKRYYKRPLLHNQYVVLIFNLLLADIQQATAFLLCLHWVNKGAVSYPSAACVLQGWWIQVADPGSGLFVIAIAMHTGAVVLRGRQLPYKAFVFCVVSLWAFIIALGIIPVALYRSETFVISEAGWCWISPEHEDERLWGHYLWIFLAEFGTLVLYGILFFYLRRRMLQAAELRQNHSHTDNLHRLNRVVIYMVIYPLAYLLLSLPLAAGRMSSARHVIPSKAYFAVAGSLMALSGLVDAAVYTLTRRQLLVDTELSHSGGRGTYPYAAYSGSHAYQTHISTTGAMGTGERDGKGKGKRGRKPSLFRRGLQTLNDTVTDGRDDSTEEIVRKDDLEMKNIGRGVYQETTIEITHERVVVGKEVYPDV